MFARLKRTSLNDHHIWMVAIITSFSLVALPTGNVGLSPGSHLLARFVQGNQTTMADRVAMRLHQRLQRNKLPTPSVTTLKGAMRERQQLLSKRVEVQVKNPDGTGFTNWAVSAQRYPAWLQPLLTSRDLTYEFDADQIIDTWQRDIAPTYQIAEYVTVEGVEEVNGVRRAVTDDIGKAGIKVDLNKLAESVQAALVDDTEVVAVNLQTDSPQIFSSSLQASEPLTLLAGGKSNFTNSTWARSQNVRKALRDHVNNVIVAPGEKFSFNQTLNGIVSTGNGWQMAKIIKEGALEYAPGGGICQASTTVYRAIVNAGLPVVNRRSHSMYVSYYKAHGVGIDATIYPPGGLDLSFINDTENDILIQAYTEGYDAFVNFYGIPDGRLVALEGPYFDTNAPADLRVNGRTLRKNEIAWRHRVTYPNGEERQETILSKYQTLPQIVKREFDSTPETMHASAS